ncbi:hypothetical protein LSAT2_026526, partial [Lamellibrachia satsuma]
NKYPSSVLHAATSPRLTGSSDELTASHVLHIVATSSRVFLRLLKTYSAKFKKQNMTNRSHNSSIWDNSPYMIFRNEGEEEEEGEEETGDTVDPILQRKNINLEEQLKKEIFPPVIHSEPPLGYFAEFKPEVQNQFSEEGDLLSNTTLGRVVDSLKMNSANSMRNEEVQKQSKFGAKFMDDITKVPLSDFWHRVTQVFAVVIFVANAVSALYDVAREPQNLHYKLPSIFFGLVASILLFLWFNFRPNFAKLGWSMDEGHVEEGSNEGRLEEGSKMKKKQQYIENIFHEALLYPIIVLSVFGFANDTIATDPFGRVQLVLLIIDAIDALWTQIVRIYMIHRFVEDIRAVLGSKVDIGLNILLRGIITTISNLVLFIFLIILLGLQVHNDNYCNTHDSNTDIWCKNMTNNSSTDPLKYRGSVNSTFLLIAVVLLPLFNLVMFVVVNYFWVLELLLLLGAESKEDKWKDTDIGRTVADIADMAKASFAKLDDMRSAHPLNRFISVVTEPVFAAMILVWEVILVLAIYYYDGCHHSLSSVCSRDVVQTFFVLIAIVTNSHAVIVAILFDAGIVIAAAAVLFYPLSFPLFLKRDDIVPVEESQHS